MAVSVHKPPVLLPSSVLFNHLIIEKGLEHLEVPELKNVRLVCKFWNQVGTTFLAKKVEVSLEGNRLDQFLNCISTSRPYSVSTFTSYTVKINSLQSVNRTVATMWSSIHFNIKHLYLHITTVYARNELESLLFLHFPSIKSIKLVIMKYWGVADVVSTEIAQDENRASNTQPNPNLSSFQVSYLGSTSLYGFDDGGSDEDFYLPVNWRCFFLRFPKLSHISFNGLSSEIIGEMLAALISLQMESPNTSFTLKSLEILDENMFPQSPNDENLIQLTKLQNEFESIHLEVSPFVTTLLLNDLLKKHAVSLKNLRLRRYPFFPQSSLIYLNDNNLSQVRFFEISEDLLPSLSFLPYMPSLEKLHILIRDYSHLNCCDIVHNTSISNPARIAHSGVKFLYIEPPLMSKDCIEKLSLCLPGLEGIKLRVNNQMITEICKIACQESSPCWKHIKDLHVISWEGLTDEGITGIADEILKFWGGFSSNMEVRNYRNKPFIGDIADLQSLTIEMWSDYNNHISDYTVLYGVQEVKNLQEVAFIRCEITSSCYSSIQIPKKFIIH